MKTFYCYTHNRYEPRSEYGGKVGGYSHCTDTIAEARKEKERRRKEARKSEMAKLKLKARVALATGSSKRDAQKLHEKSADKAFERELARIEREAVEYDY